MSEGITKEELMMLVEVQTKTAAQMERVVMSLSTIVEDQKKILDKLGNGVVKEIEAYMEKGCNKICQDIAGLKVDISESKNKLNWLTIILGSVTLIVVISTAILNFNSGIYQVRHKINELEARMK
jgi:cell division protein FtsL